MHLMGMGSSISATAGIEAHQLSTRLKLALSALDMPADELSAESPRPFKDLLPLETERPIGIDCCDHSTDSITKKNVG
jgi:hypothetical protein